MLFPSTDGQLVAPLAIFRPWVRVIDGVRLTIRVKARLGIGMETGVISIPYPSKYFDTDSSRSSVFCV